MLNHSQQSKARGVTLIEVLIALLIFSFGLVGIAGLLVMATSANHSGYQRTQVEYLAQNMADRMSANPIGVWGGDYDSMNYPLSVSQLCSTDCDPAQLAAYDQMLWSDQLRAFLPDPEATIDCVETIGYKPNASELLARPVYSGNCLMTISWTERGIGASAEREGAKQTYTWKFQP